MLPEETKYSFKDIDKLIPYARNARTHSDSQVSKVAASIKEFGFINPVIVDKNDGIIAGHCRVLAAKKLNMDKVPTLLVDHLTEAQKKAYMLADNRIALDSDWDEELLKLEIEELKSLDFDISLTGFDLKEFDADLLKEEDDFIVEVPNEPKSKLGDLYILGNHRLLCGDSTNPDHVNKLLDGANPILMVTDPPYGVNYNPQWREDAGKGATNVGKVLNDDRFDWSEAYSLFTGNIAYIWHFVKYTHKVAEHIENCGFDLISLIFWSKQHFAISRGDYHNQHEPVWYAVRKDAKHNWQGKRDQSTVWKIDNNNFGAKTKEEQTGHGTQKPLECMLRPILNNSAAGESVYDPFGGSGTTLIACEKSKRNCYMMELNPAYVDIIVGRWEKETGKKAELVASHG